ncbi:MAG: sugar-binding protein [Chloroflexota bacterium]
MRYRLGLWLALLLGCTLAACASTGVPPARTPTPLPERRKLVIAWIPKALDNPVFQVGRLGAVQKALELSATGPVDVEILYVGSVASDAAEQVRVLEDVVARRVDAIAISCNDPTACIDPINRAVEAGIPVMTWDADSPQSNRFTYYGLDNIEAGKAAANLLVNAMGTEGKVAVLTGVPGAFNLEERIRGFRQGLTAYPNIQIVTTVVTNDDINQGVQVLEETMQAYPDLDGWFFAGMWPLFAERGSMPLWEDAALNRGMKTVAFDALPVELEMLRDGYLSGLIDQKNWGWGYETIQIVYDHIVENKRFDSFTNSGFNIITHNNVDALLEMWKTNNFNLPLPPP